MQSERQERQFSCQMRGVLVVLFVEGVLVGVLRIWVLIFFIVIVGNSGINGIYFVVKIKNGFMSVQRLLQYQVYSKYSCILGSVIMFNF